MASSFCDEMTAISKLFKDTAHVEHTECVQKVLGIVLFKNNKKRGCICIVACA